MAGAAEKNLASGEGLHRRLTGHRLERHLVYRAPEPARIDEGVIDIPEDQSRRPSPTHAAIVACQPGPAANGLSEIVAHYAQHVSKMPSPRLHDDLLSVRSPANCLLARAAHKPTSQRRDLVVATATSLHCGRPVWPTMVLAGKLDGALADRFPGAEPATEFRAHYLELAASLIPPSLTTPDTTAGGRP